MRSTLLLIRQGNQTIEEQMAPWCKEIRIEGYWGEPVTEEEKQDLIDDYIRDMRDVYEEEVDNPSFEEAYQEHGEVYNENGKTKTASGATGLNGNTTPTESGTTTS